MYVLCTKPARRIAHPNWRVHQVSTQKYVQVQPNGKFKFVTNEQQATVFKTASDLLTAVSLRAQQVRKITNDLTWAEATVGGIKVGAPLNGDRY